MQAKVVSAFCLHLNVSAGPICKKECYGCGLLGSVVVKTLNQLTTLSALPSTALHTASFSSWDGSDLTCREQNIALCLWQSQADTHTKCHTCFMGTCILWKWQWLWSIICYMYYCAWSMTYPYHVGLMLNFQLKEFASHENQLWTTQHVKVQISMIYTVWTLHFLKSPGSCLELLCKH